MNEFMYYVNGRYFTTLKSARNYATGDHGRDVLLTLGDYDETILSYNPMSERLERFERPERYVLKNEKSNIG